MADAKHPNGGGPIAFLFENSIFLIAGAAIGLVWANVDHHSYEAIAHNHSFHFAVNDILMAFFFLIAGKEIREAMLPGGPLSSARTAALPIMATLGGMLGPAGIYVAGTILFDAPELTNGWAVPMATDIAFSYMVARLIFPKVGGKTHPAIVFLLLLAIADDAGGLIVLATFYPQAPSETILSIAGQLGVAPEMVRYIGFGLMAAAPVIGIVLWKVFRLKSFWFYLAIGGVVSWAGFYAAGIHPALALVPLAWCMPHEHSDVGLWAVGESRGKDTLNQMEHWWKNPVEIILGLFGFVNAGVVFSAMGIGTALVFVGLLVGKPVGIVLMTKVGQLFGLKLPEGMGTKDLVVVGFAAGIGFTVALFVSIVAFPAGDILDSVKMGALFSFFVAPITLFLAKVLGVMGQKSR